MKIAVHDPLAAFTPFMPWMEAWADQPGNEFLYIDVPVSAQEMLWQHRHNDIVWYEFCDNFTAACINGIEGDAKIVNRLHSYEYFTDIPKSVKWSKVDLLIASSKEMKALLEKQRRDIEYPPIDVLANGVDLTRFSMANKSNGTKLAVVGAVNYKKNLPLALYILHKMHDIGLRFELHILGAMQDRRFELYLTDMAAKMGLSDFFRIHEPLPHGLVGKWLEDKDYILSTSLFESFGQSIMEGVATGCIPLVHNFAGAEDRFPKEWLFGPIDEAASKLVGYHAMPPHSRLDLQKENRAYVEDSFGVQEQIENLAHIMAKVTPK